MVTKELQQQQQQSVPNNEKDIMRRSRNADNYNADLGNIIEKCMYYVIREETTLNHRNLLLQQHRVRSSSNSTSISSSNQLKQKDSFSRLLQFGQQPTATTITSQQQDTMLPYHSKRDKIVQLMNE
jgi:hypothetical protein